MGVRNVGWGAGRPRDVRAWVSWGMDGGVDIFVVLWVVGGGLIRLVETEEG
jgi:hypothetical protein